MRKVITLTAIIITAVTMLNSATHAASIKCTGLNHANKKTDIVFDAEKNTLKLNAVTMPVMTIRNYGDGKILLWSHPQKDIIYSVLHERNVGDFFAVYNIKTEIITDGFRIECTPLRGIPNAVNARLPLPKQV